MHTHSSAYLCWGCWRVPVFNFLRHTGNVSPEKNSALLKCIPLLMKKSPKRLTTRHKTQPHTDRHQSTCFWNIDTKNFCSIFAPWKLLLIDQLPDLLTWNGVKVAQRIDIGACVNDKFGMNTAAHCVSRIRGIRFYGRVWRFENWNSNHGGVCCNKR